MRVAKVASGKSMLASAIRRYAYLRYIVLVGLGISRTTTVASSHHAAPRVAVIAQRLRGTCASKLPHQVRSSHAPMAVTMSRSAAPESMTMDILNTMNPPLSQPTPDTMLPSMGRSKSGHAMPDIAASAPVGTTGVLDLVGMSDIEIPLRWSSGALIPARASAFVSLDDPDAKGIHMSRLYLHLQEFLNHGQLDAPGLQELLCGFLRTHEGLSHRARVELAFDLPLQRPALVSDNWGWRSYPATIEADLGPQGFTLAISVRVTYSSTCPCSAALARQLIQERFDRDFSQRQDLSAEEIRAWLGREDAICATPHSQRSHADVQVRIGNGADLGHESLIDVVEGALKTPVQAAVKREDEQEFARLNGQNLMFCEDAGRRLTAVLNAHPAIADFRVRASHRESLHPHDAVSVAVKGVAGGYRP